MSSGRDVEFSRGAKTEKQEEVVTGERVFHVGGAGGLVVAMNCLLLWRVAISEGRWQLQSSRRQLPGLHLQA